MKIRKRKKQQYKTKKITDKLIIANLVVNLISDFYDLVYKILHSNFYHNDKKISRQFNA
jgi:hypothetical protein